MNRFNNPAVEKIFDSYPLHIQPKMLVLRDLIFKTAAELDSEYTLEETLKWGEPSYLIKSGTAIRIDWKESKPEHLGIYVNCQTKLIDTFRTVFSDKLLFEGNRAILLDIDSPIPKDIIRECIQVAFTYHQRKELPLLGI